MEFEAQQVETLLGALSLLEIEWQDELAQDAIASIELFPVKLEYGDEDIIELLSENFRVGSLVARLFLGLSKDSYEAELKKALGEGGIGIKRFQSDQSDYLSALKQLGLLTMMQAVVNRQPKWSDVLVERLRSGRGSAVSGQRRGRHVEDFAEVIIKKVFGDRYHARCNFVGRKGVVAKCDFAIPTREEPRIVVESKGYGATGSKMTDVIGDIEKIIAAKRSDTPFIFFTDGLSWMQRKADFKKIVEYQNQGDIFRIYTVKMADQFLADLETLKAEQGL